MGIVLSLCTVIVVASSCALLLLQTHGHTPMVVRSAQTPGEPVAVIAPLPDEVSNGTWQNLDGGDSYDDDGWIANFTWSITIGDSTTHIWGKSESFKFRTLGLYKITLTVTDNDNKSATAFTAVYSIVDSDRDGLPDWWEAFYFYGKLQFTGNDDNDGDEYTNLQEFASGTNPTVNDPQPGLVQMLADNWVYLAIIAAAIVGAILAIWPRLKKKRKREEKKMIEAAIEIEHALESEK